MRPPCCSDKTCNLRLSFQLLLLLLGFCSVYVFWFKDVNVSSSFVILAPSPAPPMATRVVGHGAFGIANNEVKGPKGNILVI